ncbi:siderophore ABC transporter substrate-binding protein [Acidovorax sp. NCPPB 2350]|nr:siderophore ABC transporter substrate-binding protein [Acidovorax sp. NCPPB 2350]
MGLGLLPAFAQTSITHAKGTTVMPAVPRTVLVYDLAALDILQALGVEVQGVPEVKFPPYLQSYADAKYRKIGSLFEPNLEVVNATRPDLVIVAGRSSAKYPDLAKLAPTIDLTVDPKDFLPGVFRNVETLGRIFGKQARAQELVTQAKAEIAALKQQGETAGKGLIVLTTGGKMSAYGPGSRFGVLHDAFGIAPAQSNLTVSNHGQAVSFEFILQTNPDWLFVIDRDAAIGRDGTAAARQLDNELVRQTKAWRKKQVVYLDAARWYSLGSAGITALRDNVAQLSTALSQAGA